MKQVQIFDKDEKRNQETQKGSSRKNPVDQTDDENYQG